MLIYTKAGIHLKNCLWEINHILEIRISAYRAMNLYGQNLYRVCGTDNKKQILHLSESTDERIGREAKLYDCTGSNQRT